MQFNRIRHLLKNFNRKEKKKADLRRFLTLPAAVHYYDYYWISFLYNKQHICGHYMFLSTAFFFSIRFCSALIATHNRTFLCQAYGGNGATILNYNFHLIIFTTRRHLDFFLYSAIFFAIFPANSAYQHFFFTTKWLVHVSSHKWRSEKQEEVHIRDEREGDTIRWAQRNKIYNKKIVVHVRHVKNWKFNVEKVEVDITIMRYSQPPWTANTIQCAD